MTTEEFWDKYYNESSLEIFDETCEFFSKEIPQEFIDEYDVEEVILETVGHQESAKNFDNVIKFLDILQKNQPGLYEDYFQHFNDILIHYYCFKHDKSKVFKAFSRFINKPLQEIDIYLSTFKKLIYYQYSELLEEAVKKNFDTINEASNLMGGTAYELAIHKYYSELQRLFEKQKENLDKVAFSSKLSKFDFEFDDDFLSSIELGVLKPPLSNDEISALFAKDKINSVMVLQGYYHRYMYEKGFEFYLSGRIWDSMLIFWDENKDKDEEHITLNSYFTVQAELLEKHLVEIFRFMLMDNKSEMIAVLWGSVYIYEFLHKTRVISTETFQNFIEISRILKGKVIGQYTPYLWNSNFVHYWEKPETISEAEFIEENNIFKKSILFEYENFDHFRDTISDELTKIGELSDYIIEGGKDNSKMINYKSPLGNLWSEFNEMHGGNHNVSYEPIRVEKKVGRNESCPCGSGKKYKKCCG